MGFKGEFAMGGPAANREMIAGILHFELLSNCQESRVIAS